MWVLKFLSYTDTRDIINFKLLVFVFTPAPCDTLSLSPFLHRVRWCTQVSYSAHNLRDDIPHWDAPPRLLLCRLYHKPHPEGPCSALHRLRRVPEGRVLPSGDGRRERAIGLLQGECSDIDVNCNWVDTCGSSTVHIYRQIKQIIPGRNT